MLRIGRQASRTLPAATVVCLLTASAGSAQDNPQGFYVGVNAGLAASAAVDSSRYCQLGLLLAELPHAPLPRIPVFP